LLIKLALALCTVYEVEAVVCPRISVVVAHALALSSSSRSLRYSIATLRAFW
jgi:hypothetical protein